jgi:hypothetical protein
MIVGSKKDAINVADLVAGANPGGVRLLPRPLADGRYALPDSAKTDPETAAAHTILAGWSNEPGPLTYLDGVEFNVNTRARFLVNQGERVYSQIGGRGGGTFTCPADNVFRFSAGPNDGLPEDLPVGKRRSMMGDTKFNNVFGVTNAQTSWAAFTFIPGDLPAVAAGVDWEMFFEWHTSNGNTGGFSPPLTFVFHDGELQVVTRSSASVYPSTGDGKDVIHHRSPIPAKGVKHNYVLQTTFGQAGHLNVWLNGTQIVDADSPIGYYSNAGATNWAVFGMYGSASTHTDVGFIANPEWSFNSLADRITTPLPVPDLDWN